LENRPRAVELASRSPGVGTLPAGTMKDILDHVINTCGIAEATRVTVSDHQVVLSGSGDGCR